MIHSLGHLARGAIVLVTLLALSSCTHRPAPQTPDTETDATASVAPESIAPPANESAAPAAPTTTSTDPIVRIRDEGLNRSQVMKTLSYLADVIGPRLTASPSQRRASAWVQERLTSWGLQNAHQEAWGSFGKGWSLKRFSAEVIEPQTIPLIAYPKAWSPGFAKPLTGPVVYFHATTESDFEKYRGKLRGAIVLLNPARPTPAHFEAPGVRINDTDLLKFANADVGNMPFPGLVRAPVAPVAAIAPDRKELLTPTTRPATQPATTQVTRSTASRPGVSAPPGSPRALAFERHKNEFLMNEGAAMLVSVSSQGDGGTLFVASASSPVPFSSRRPATQYIGSPATRPVWALDGPTILPQMTVAAEHYNRMVRMIEQGAHLKMTVDLQVEFDSADPMAYNTIAEIPGTDLKDQIVMLGAHLDSWHSGTGATDNGAGVAATMEAVRILKALNLQPRRTIRIALWTGEEQGLFGSKAYVAKHFGKLEPATRPSTRTTTRLAGARPTSRPASRPTEKLMREAEYERLSAYFNLDNGTGKIRGVYLQGNETVRPIFRKWLAPFADLGAQTLTLTNTGGTDHVSFDAIGLPAFQFIQDPIEYWSRTHHSNQDVFDRIQADDLKQASTIIAAFIYDAAMQDEKLPRKAMK